AGKGLGPFRLDHGGNLPTVAAFSPAVVDTADPWVGSISMTTGASAQLPDRRVRLVHAHPDDESIGNGATMAMYAAQGVHVTLVTCTRGEEGEVLVPELVSLAADADDK